MPIMNTVIQGGGTTPTGTKSITANGTYDVAAYANADVNVPTTAPDYYEPFIINQSGFLEKSGIIDLSSSKGSFKLNSSSGLRYGNQNLTSLSGAVDFSGVTEMAGQSLYYTFNGCTGITSADLSGVQQIYGNNALMDAFASSGITELDLSGLQTIGKAGYLAGSALSAVCQNCTNLTTVKFGNNIQWYDNTQAQNSVFSNAFSGCTALTSVSGRIKSANGSQVFQQMFNGCTALETCDLFSEMTSLSGARAMYRTFANTRIRTLNLGSLRTISGGTSSSQSVLYQCCNGANLLTTVDIHSLESAPENSFYQAFYMNTSLTTVLWPSDVSNINFSYAFQGCTSLSDLSGLTFPENIGYHQFLSAFSECSSIISVDMSNIKSIKAAMGISDIFSGCTRLASVDISGLEQIGLNDSDSTSKVSNCFFNTAITTLDFVALNKMYGPDPVAYMCTGMTNLTNVYFRALTSQSFGTNTDIFTHMLDTNVSGCTIHFPSNLQSVIGSWTSIINGLGGTNTTVLFDLPATE